MCRLGISGNANKADRTRQGHQTLGLELGNVLSGKRVPMRRRHNALITPTHLPRLLSVVRRPKVDYSGRGGGYYRQFGCLG
ncbi:30S ribosomal subunit protein S14 [Candidatus Hodgkinia cicadicola]|nr:30S ribosomal subunit protein S14 [Candidatus Hodgkinia cicadicola]